jgi:hypothetical protein
MRESKGRTFRSISFLKRVSRQDAKHAKERFLIPWAILAALREKSAIRKGAPLAAAPIGTRLPWFERGLGNVLLFACPQFSGNRVNGGASGFEGAWGGVFIEGEEGPCSSRRTGRADEVCDEA